MSGGPGDSPKDRDRAIAGFAALLRGLRVSAGTPSFREMAGRSRAISHTTLHEAAQGNRLPSWATTAEFIKACGADPADYRDRWEAANQVVRAVSAGVRAQAPLSSPPPSDPGLASASAVDRLPAATDQPTAADNSDDRLRQPGGTPAPAVAQEGGAPGSAAEGGASQSASREGGAPASAVREGGAPRSVLPRHRSAVIGASVVGTAAVIVAGAFLVQRFTDDQPSSLDVRNATSADCPVRQQNPPPSPPAQKGDLADFVSDITLPDCTHIARGSTVEKVWRFRNKGTVRWHGYTLHRIDLPQRRGQCQTVVDTPIPETPPGGLVDIRTWVTAPAEQGFCFVRFKMLDSDGNVAFPGSRPLNFQVIVD
ncbi:NBR1-Ig-like domain-containing protein [Actinomadura sp. 9N215]|uniref:NBR1-Ig-like domain-containing protein n=1 Tax=Actinomadura sp. 9N215 TaxID=3375150 RepID=UPI003790F807